MPSAIVNIVTTAHAIVPSATRRRPVSPVDPDSVSLNAIVVPGTVVAYPPGLICGVVLVILPLDSQVSWCSLMIKRAGIRPEGCLCGVVQSRPWGDISRLCDIAVMTKFSFPPSTFSGIRPVRVGLCLDRMRRCDWTHHCEHDEYENRRGGDLIFSRQGQTEYPRFARNQRTTQADAPLVIHRPSQSKAEFNSSA